MTPDASSYWYCVMVHDVKRDLAWYTHCVGVSLRGHGCDQRWRAARNRWLTSTERAAQPLAQRLSMCLLPLAFHCLAQPNTKSVIHNMPHGFVYYTQSSGQTSITTRWLIISLSDILYWWWDDKTKHQTNTNSRDPGECLASKLTAR